MFSCLNQSDNAIHSPFVAKNDGGANDAKQVRDCECSVLLPFNGVETSYNVFLTKSMINDVWIRLKYNCNGTSL